MKVLVLLETGKMRHVPMGGAPHDDIPVQFSGQFNMNQWRAENDCGTIACIGGTAEAISGENFRAETYLFNKGLQGLFYPPDLHKRWHDITPAQAATALRSYLTTGDARWDLALTS